MFLNQQPLIMKLKPSHHQKAMRIDHYVNQILLQGGNDEHILQNMYDYMSDFKFLLDHSPNGEIQLLIQQYQGFYRFVKVLENLAHGIAEGVIDLS